MGEKKLPMRWRSNPVMLFGRFDVPRYELCCGGEVLATVKGVRATGRSDLLGYMWYTPFGARNDSLMTLVEAKDEAKRAVLAHEVRLRGKSRENGHG